MDGLGLVGMLCIVVGLGLTIRLALRPRLTYGDVEPQEADLDTITEATPMPETYRTAGRVYTSDRPTFGRAFRAYTIPDPVYPDIPSPGTFARGQAHLRSVPMCACQDGGIGALLDSSDPWCRRCGGAR